MGSTTKKAIGKKVATSEPSPPKAAPPFDAVQQLAILSTQWESRAHREMRKPARDVRALAVARILKAAFVAFELKDAELAAAGKRAGAFLERKHWELARDGSPFVNYASADGSPWLFGIADVEPAKGSLGGRAADVTTQINTIDMWLRDGDAAPELASSLVLRLTFPLGGASLFLADQGIHLDFEKDGDRLRSKLTAVFERRLANRPKRLRELARRLLVDALKAAGVKPVAAEDFVKADHDLRPATAGRKSRVVE